MSESPLREIYVSTDIETDGPLAGKHSMLSIGSAAYLADKELLGTFSANLETLPASAPDPKNAAWWATQPDAWSACTGALNCSSSVEPARAVVDAIP